MDNTERKLANALDSIEWDRVALNEMKDRVAKADEWWSKLTASEKEVATLRAELLQVKEQLSRKEVELAKITTDQEKMNTEMAK